MATTLFRFTLPPSPDRFAPEAVAGLVGQRTVVRLMITGGDRVPTAPDERVGVIEAAELLADGSLSISVALD